MFTTGMPGKKPLYHFVYKGEVAQSSHDVTHGWQAYVLAPVLRGCVANTVMGPALPPSAAVAARPVNLVCSSGTNIRARAVAYLRRASKTAQ